MIILDGKQLGQKIASQLKEAISVLKDDNVKIPHLIIIQIGNNPASNVYVGRKVKFAENIGATVHVEKFSETVQTEELIEYIKEQNSNDNVTGMILQLPIPEAIDLAKVLNSIDPQKDVDGLGATNIHGLVKNDGNFLVPATTKGVIRLLQENNIEIVGKDVVVVGRSLLVGKSMALNFINHDATVTLCHKETKDLVKHTRDADILVVATGQKGLITSDHVNSGQIIIDVGISVVDGQIYGDVNREDVKEVAGLSPVPGGVGPMTVASLFENLLEAYKMQNK
jgi:methylenetetrahydrofolate dehydrogenase (NADP+)/methenyltetrahydrofolate cyclohydrolase